MFDAYVAGEVALRLPAVEICSLAFQKSSQNVLAGCKTGVLLVYGKNSRNQFELEAHERRFERKAVYEMRICDSMQILLCLSDQQITVHDMSPSVTGYPLLATLSALRPVNTFAIYENTEDGQLYVAVSSKKRIYLFKWFGGTFHDIAIEGQHSFTDIPTRLCWCGGNLAFAVKDEYMVMKMKPNEDYKIWTSDLKKVCNFSDHAIVVNLIDRLTIGFARGEVVTMSNYSGEKAVKCADVRFSGIVLDVVYDSPYLIALLPKGHLEIRSIDPPQLVQSITLKQAHMISNAMSGYVLAGSGSDMWLLDSLENLRKNVGILMQEKNFALAIQLAERSEIFTDENKAEIRRQFAINLFHQKKFEECFNMHSEIGTEALSVIQLIPDVLPDLFRSQMPKLPPLDMAENDKKRAIMAMGDYLAATRSRMAQRLDVHYSAKHDHKKENMLDKEELDKIKVNLQIIDTTLLGCYLRTKPMMVDSLLRLRNNSCVFEAARTMLLDSGRLSSLFILYETRKRHELALELLREQAQRPENELDPFFAGVERTVEYLQTLGNPDLDLIFRYAKWVLQSDMQAGLEIFTSPESELSVTLDRERVVEFLRKECVAAVIPYLEHIIMNWDEKRPKFHEQLASLYVVKVKTLFQDYVHVFKDDERIIRAGSEEGDLGVYRRKLLKFLETSKAYTPNTILMQLSSHAFYEERAIILGWLQQHEQALTIYTSILHDYEAAEKYCALYYDKGDEVNSQVYLLLFRSFVQPRDPEIAGLSASTLPIPSPNITQAIEVLRRHADKMDKVEALQMIPPTTPLRVLSKALNIVLQTTHDEATACTLHQAVCASALSRTERLLDVALSVRINVTATSECVHCKKKIGNGSFVRLPHPGGLLHLFCFEKSAEGYPL